MRKITMIIGFLLIALSSYAMPIEDMFGMEFGMDFGWASQEFGGYTRQYESFKDELSPNLKYDAITTSFEKSILFYNTLRIKGWFMNTLFVGGSITVQEDALAPYTPGYWVPTFLNYEFNAGIKWKVLTLTYIHECTHPQETSSFAYRVTSLWGEGTTDRVMLSVKSSIGNVPK